MSAYDKDLAAWSVAQADALRRFARTSEGRRATNEIDFDNIADEVEAVGSSQRKEIRSRLKVLLVHLLKWRYQPDYRSNSWEASIEGARDEIKEVLADSPSLHAFPNEALAGAYRAAIRSKAVRHIELMHLPKTCPWPIEQVLNDEWLPD